MRKGSFIGILLCITFILSSCSGKKDTTASNSDTTKLTKEQWIEDIDYLKTNLAKKHKNIYHTISKEDYNKKFEDLKNEVPNLKADEIKLKLAQIVASVGDAHTALRLGFEQDTDKYQLGLWWFGKNLKVLSIEKEYKDILGYNLTAINNIPIEQVMDKVNSLISHENEQWLKYNNPNYVVMPEVLRFLGIVKDKNAEFTFCDDKGVVKKLNLSPKTYKKEDLINSKDLITEESVIKGNNSNAIDNLYWYKYIPKDKIMYFQYNECIDRDVAKNYGIKDYEKYPEFSKFGDELIKEINEKNIDKLIIDLRYNSGGNSMLMSDFAVKLSKIEKLKGKGKVFAIISRETFSSGVMACMDLKNENNAIFFGEPTGGNVNGYGDIKMITMPNSKIEVSYSTKYFELSSDYKNEFTPDVTIEQSYDNFMKGIDDAYEAIKNYKN